MTKRWLGLTLALMVWCTSALGELTPGVAETTEVYSEGFEADVELATDVGDTGLSADLDGVVEDGFPEDAGDGDEEPADAGEAPRLYYARVTSEALWLRGEDAVAMLSRDDVLLVTGEDDQGRLTAALRVSEAALTGVVTSGDVEMLTQAEFDAFMDGILADENVLYEGQLDYPLPAPECAVTPVAPREDADTPPSQGPEMPGDEAPPSEEPETVDGPSDPDAVDVPLTDTPDAPATEEPADASPASDGDGVGDTVDGETGEDGDETPDSDALAEEAGDDKDGDEADAGEGTGASGDGAQPSKGEETPAAPTLCLNMDALTLGVGETCKKLTVEALDADGVPAEGLAIVWKSADAKIAKVTATGAVTGVKAGVTEIIVSAEGCEDAVLPVTVGKAPTKLTLSATTLKLGVGMPDVRLEWTVNDGAACQGVTFTSSNKKVATVSADGMVTAVGKGSATITVRTYNYAYAVCRVTVTNAPARVVLGAQALTLGEGETFHLSASAVDAAGAATGSTFMMTVDPESPDPGCVRVDAASGDITAVALGRAVIDVDSYVEGVGARCEVEVRPAPADIAINGAHETAVTIGVGETYRRAPAVLTDAEGGSNCASNVRWTSSDAKVAKVAPDGAITGVKSGRAVITAATHNGLTASVNVTVKAAPWTVTMKPKTLSLGADGMTFQLNAELNSGAASGVLTFTSSDPDVVQVLDDATGLIRAMEKGKATITVRTFNKRTATCKVTVSGAPAQVNLGAEALTLGVGQSTRLNASARDADGAAAEARFTAGVDESSADPGCVRVDPDTGEITALEPGSAVVRVQAHNGVSAVCAVRVVPAPEDIVIHGADAELTIGLREVYRRLSCELIPPEGETECQTEVRWSSSSASVVKVGADGAITGLRPGSATITATTHNGRTASVAVKVKNAPYTIALTPKTAILSDGMTVQLTASANAGAASGAYTFSSADETVAVVDAQTGLVSAVGTGETTVTALSFNGKKATARIIVKCQPASVVLRDDTLLLAEGMRGKIVPGAVDASGAATESTYTFAVDDSSLDPECIEVDAQTGTVTGVARGEACVRVTALNGVYALCTVKVVDAPDAISLAPEAVTLGVKESFAAWTLTRTPEESAAEITWSSSNPKVASVSAVGTITGQKTGTATVTATTHNGKTATIRVVVMNAPYLVTISPTKLKLSVGMEAALSAKINANSASHRLTYTSSNPAVVEVTDAEAGTVRAVGIGTANITVKTYNGRTSRCAVTVTGAPASLQLKPAQAAIIAGQTVRITGEPLDDAGKATVADYTFAIDPDSPDPDCASVDEGGIVTGLCRGQAIILAVTHNGVEGRCAVDVAAAPADIELLEPELEIGLLENYAGLPDTVKLVPPSGEETCRAVLSYRTTNKSVVTVNATTGKMTGMRLGTAEIIVATHNGIEKAVRVTVKSAPTTVTLSPSKLRMSPGMAVPLTVSFNAKGASRTIKYTSSKPAVAEVDENGVVTALSVGSATISARAYNGRMGKATVVVTGPPDQVTVNETLTMAVGMERALNIVALDVAGEETSAQYTFVCEAGEGVVEIDDTGRVTALKEGVARIRVVAHNGVDTHLDASGTRVATVCKITVLAPPATIRMDSTLKLRMGETASLMPRLYTAAGKQCDIDDYAFDITGDAASISDDGTVTGLLVGSAVVTVTAYNGVSASCEVQVTQRYRLFAAYSYFQTGKSDDLYFTQNNAYSVRTAFRQSSISDMRYDMVGMLKNPSKASLLNGIRRAFADGIDSDINVVYLCSHGYNYVDVDVLDYRNTYGRNPPTHYGLMLPGYEGWYSDPSLYITSEEIFDAVSSIPGHVVLILDSCFSGEFITCMKSRLDATGGRISVLTASSNTKACYYNIKDTSHACDFFTYYLLQGIGYDARDGALTGGSAADANKDGQFTVSELFNYAKQQVRANLPRFAKESWFKGDPNQTPRVYLGANASLVLFMAG